MDAIKAKLSNAIVRFNIRNDDRLYLAQRANKPVVILLGRVTRLDSLAEKLFDKAHQLRGTSPSAARQHVWNEAKVHAEKLNKLSNKLW